MLKKLRILMGACCLVAILCLFLDYSGTMASHLGWLARLQFMPAVLALHGLVVVLWVLVTLLVGRIYCSVICPLGVWQDLIMKLTAPLFKHSKDKGLGHYRYRGSRQVAVCRVVVLVVFLVALCAGVTLVVQLLAPYSIFGRFCTLALQPLYQHIANFFAARAADAGDFSTPVVEVWMRSLPALVLALASIIIVSVMAAVGGRAYCNTFCPVGTVLGFLSHHSLFGVHIEADKCKSCRRCERACKGMAIYIPTPKERAEGRLPMVNGSRCVDCFDCLEECSHGAITFSRRKVQPAPVAAQESAGPSRRAFLVAGLTVAAHHAAEAVEKTTDGGMAVLTDKKPVKREQPICPPGTPSWAHLQQHCTGCQLCVSECPNDVLRPSSDLSHLLTPESSYERGWCRPECTRCSDVCPAGAILRFEGESEERRAVKASTKIGTAHYVQDNCLITRDGITCGLCARRCPTGAITMVAQGTADDPNAPRYPVVDEERCIGCGACEYHCPASPFSAIYVEGLQVPRKI